MNCIIFLNLYLPCNSNNEHSFLFPLFCQHKKRHESSQFFANFFQRAIAIMFSNLLLNPYKLALVGSYTLGLITFQELNDLVGTDRAVFFFSRDLSYSS